MINKYSNVYSKKENVIVFVLSFTTLLIALTAAFFSTFSLSANGPSRDDLAQVLLYTLVPGVAAVIATIGFGKRAVSIAPGMTALILLAVALVQAIDFSQAQGFELLGRGGEVVISFIFSLSIAAPLTIIGFRKLQQTNTRLIRPVGLYTGLFVILIGAVFVAPIQNDINATRSEFFSDNRGQAERARVQDAENEMVENKQDETEPKYTPMLKTALGDVIRELEYSVAKNREVPESITPPENFEFTEFEKVNRLTVKFCLKSVDANVFLGAFVQPKGVGTTNDSYSNYSIDRVDSSCVYDDSNYTDYK